MYTLRIIEETRYDETMPFEQIIENFELGNSYTKIKNGVREFDAIMDEYPEEPRDLIRYIICSDHGNEFFIMENSENMQYSYFIMTESGSTFEKL